MTKMIRGKEISFKKFLEIVVSRKTFKDPAEGDFAKDALADRNFRDFRNWESLRFYLVFNHACPEALEAAESLFRKWKAGS